MKISNTIIYRSLEEDIDAYEKDLLTKLSKENDISAKQIYEYRKRVSKDIEVLNVEKVLISYNGVGLRPKINKRCTKQNIEELKHYFEQIKNSSYRLLYFVNKVSKYGTTSYAVDSKDINGIEYAYTAKELEPAKKAWEEEWRKYYAPREGYTACSRCLKQIPNNKIIYRVIFGTGRKQVFDSWIKRFVSKAYVTKENMPFCSEECAHSEQCSMEG